VFICSSYKQATCDLPRKFRCTPFQLPARMNRPTRSASVKTDRYSEVSWANFNSAFPWEVPNFN